LADRFLAAGHDVVGMDNFVTGSPDNIAHLTGNKRFAFFEHNVTNFIYVEGPLDGVLHFASPASPRDYLELPIQTLKVGSLGTHKALGIAKAKGARFLLASTSEVYGDPLVHPQPETYWGNVDPIGPRSCYDEGKRFGEALVTSWRRERGTRAAIVRIFNTYGPAMRLDDGRVVPGFLAAALAGRPLPVQGDGSQTRSYMFVSDLVDGLLHVALDPDADGEVLNIGNPHEVTVRELAERILAIMGSPVGTILVPSRPGDPQRRCPDITRMTARYGWRPTVALDDGLRRTVEWFAPVSRPVSSGGRGA